VCAGTLRDCLAGGVWSDCDYGPQHTPDEDASCDSLDNDCDGATDEDAEVLPMGEFGPQAADELDNNCNGIVDEPGGVMVRIDASTAIDAYEAVVYSSPECTGTRYGATSDDYPAGFPAVGDPGVTLYACSLPDLLPSGYLSWHRAGWACAAQGKRLCTATEYSTACRGPELSRYPYGTAFFSGWCNDGWLAEGHKEATGSYPVCESGSRLFDMSGNLGEWVSNTDPNNPSNALQGGGYYTCWICEPNGFCFACDRGSDSHKDKIMAVLDCSPGSQSVGNNFDSFHKALAPAYLGARCCLDLD
jgi:hypothetical protein